MPPIIFKNKSKCNFCVLISTNIQCMITNDNLIWIFAIPNYFDCLFIFFTLRYKSNQYLFTKTFHTTNEHTKCSTTVDLTCGVYHIVLWYIIRIWRMFNKFIIKPWGKNTQITTIDIVKLLIQSITKHTHVQPTELSIQSYNVLKFKYTYQTRSACNNTKQEVSRDSQTYQLGNAENTMAKRNNQTYK